MREIRELLADLLWLAMEDPEECIAELLLLTVVIVGSVLLIALSG